MKKSNYIKLIVYLFLIVIGLSLPRPSISENTSSEYSKYQTMIRSKIIREWVVPANKDAKDLRTSIKAMINSNGEVISAELQSSSGNKQFDQSALKAIKRASPLPIPPNSLANEVYNEGLLVEFNPSKTNTISIAESKPTQSPVPQDEVDINFYQEYVAPANKITISFYFGPKTDPQWNSTGEIEATAESISIISTLPSFSPDGPIKRKETYKWNGVKFCKTNTTPMNKITEEIDVFVRDTLPEPTLLECPYLKKVTIGTQWSDEMYDYKITGFEDMPVSLQFVKGSTGSKQYKTIKTLVVEKKESDQHIEGFKQRHPASSVSASKYQNKWQQQYYMQNVGYIGASVTSDNGKRYWMEKAYMIRHQSPAAN